MMITISLKMKSIPKKNVWKDLILLIGVTSALYFATYFALRCPIFSPPKTFSSNVVNSFVISKTGEIAASFLNYELALDFLANIRILSDETNMAFSKSGLAHLLAISGGQVSIILEPLLFILSSVFSFLFTKWTEPMNMMRFYFTIKKMIIFFLALFIAAAFGYSGALVRVICSSSISQAIPLKRVFVHFECWYHIRLSYNTLFKCLVLITFAFFYGNPFQNISFLLSYIGVELACISQDVSIKYLNHLFSSGIQLFLLNTIFSSAIITIILYPVFQCNPLVSGIANVFALPLVNYLITPLTLSVILMPNDCLFQSIQIKLLDFFLSGLDLLAKVFSSSEHSLSKTNQVLTMEESKIYLSLILILIWSFLDVKKYLEQGSFKKITDV